MKKLLALLLALMLFAPTALAVDELPGYYKPPVAKEGQYPIEEQGVTLTYWMPINSGAALFISSYDENPTYQLVQKETGVDIEFIHPAAGTDKESFQLLFGNEMPDMIQMPQDDWYNGGLQAMYDDGIIIDLTPYLDDYAPQYKEVISYDETGWKQGTSDGKVLGFYKITHAPKMPYTRFNTVKEWLDEANMAEPRTIAEYEAYFDWILENKPGVVPFWVGNFVDTGAMTMNLLTGAFDFLYDWYVTKEDPGKVGYWANAEGYKEFVTLMNKWYEKGYLGKDFLSITGTEVQALFDSNQYGVIADQVNSTYSRMGEANTPFTLTNFPYMRKDADSVVGSGLADTPIGDGGDYVTVITTSCKNVEAAIKYLNYGYTYEGSLPFSFGILGEHWYWGEDGMPKFTETMTANPKGMTISNVSYALKCHFATRYCYPDSAANIGYAMNPSEQVRRNLWLDDEGEQNFLQMPPITLTDEESTERAALMVQVDTYAKEMLVQYITGARSMDTFDQYLEDIGKYGLNRAIEITQGALDRYNRK